MHVVAGFAGRGGRGPVVFGGFDEVVDFGVDEFEDSFLGRLFVGAEFFGGGEFDGDVGGRGGGGGARGGEQVFEFEAGGFEVAQVDEDLGDLPEVLRAEAGDEGFADTVGEEFVEGLDCGGRWFRGLEDLVVGVGDLQSLRSRRRFPDFGNHRL